MQTIKCRIKYTSRARISPTAEGDCGRWRIRSAIYGRMSACGMMWMHHINAFRVRSRRRESQFVAHTECHVVVVLACALQWCLCANSRDGRVCICVVMHISTSCEDQPHNGCTLGAHQSYKSRLPLCGRRSRTSAPLRCCLGVLYIYIYMLRCSRAPPSR